MDVRTFPASHMRYFREGVTQLVNDITNDVAWRSSPDALIAGWTKVQPHQIDESITETAYVMFGPANDSTEPDPELATKTPFTVVQPADAEDVSGPSLR